MCVCGGGGGGACSVVGPAALQQRMGTVCINLQVAASNGLTICIPAHMCLLAGLSGACMVPAHVWHAAWLEIR
jgi:hypothetical protein